MTRYATDSVRIADNGKYKVLFCRVQRAPVWDYHHIKCQQLSIPAQIRVAEVGVMNDDVVLTRRVGDSGSSV